MHIHKCAKQRLPPFLIIPIYLSATGSPTRVRLSKEIHFTEKQSITEPFLAFLSKGTYVIVKYKAKLTFYFSKTKSCQINET